MPSFFSASQAFLAATLPMPIGLVRSSDSSSGSRPSAVISPRMPSVSWGSIRRHTPSWA
jgi:hypothetical protein